MIEALPHVVHALEEPRDSLFVQETLVEGDHFSKRKNALAEDTEHAWQENQVFQEVKKYVEISRVRCLMLLDIYD